MKPNLRVSSEELKSLCTRYAVHELAVFGSSVRGEARPDSDLDLLVDFEPTAQIGFLALARLTDELAKLFNARIDLVPKAGLHPRIRAAVLAEAEVLFAA